ncbi:hypothetical protein BURK2_02724 [Burkholderiales bacterium]|nr:hypothetical protein BURK2_02724 [Burkholderiales bacterium]
MSEKKRQHFVPKFYMRQFSPDTSVPVRDRKTVNILNLHQGKLIRNVGLKEQCYRDYFYGKDLIRENQFAELEGLTQPVFSRVVANRELPAYGTVDHLVMVLFTHAQAFRTEQAARRIKETDDKVNTEIMRMANVSDRAKLKALVTHDNHVNAALAYSQKHYSLLLDLECKLLVAGAGLEFATSDHPAVLYNQLFEFWDGSSHTGLGSVGLQIFYPLSPKLTLVMFDSKVYNYGSREERVIHVKSKRDVRALNTLQVVSASANVYFQTDACEPFVALQQGRPFIRKELAKLIVVPEPAGLRIGITAYDVKTNLNLSFIHIRRDGKAFVERFKAASPKPDKLIRSRGLWDDHDRFWDDVAGGRLKVSDVFQVLGNYLFRG